MHTFNSLQNDLDRIGIDPTGILMVHISCKAIGETDGRGDAVIDSLVTYMHNGLLLLPAHTGATINAENPIMDVRTTPSYVGILSELFRKRPGVHRSLHPTHSLCGKGRSAIEFLTGDHLANTPCGFETAYRRLYEQKGQILLIGVRFMENTFIHGVEEWYKVPGRIEDEQLPLYVVDFDGNTHFTPMHTYCHPFDSLNAFESEDAMISIGAVTEGKYGDADCLLCDAKRLSDGLGEMILTHSLY